MEKRFQISVMLSGDEWLKILMPSLVRKPYASAQGYILVLVRAVPKPLRLSS